MPFLPKSSVLYAATGSEISRYQVDVAACSLNKLESVRVREPVQYAWQHPRGSHLYVASSDGGKSSAGTSHHLTVFAIHNGTGELVPRGDPVKLVNRPVHTCVDEVGDYALVAYANPPRVSVHRLAENGLINEEVRQPGTLNFGIYPHQVRVMPSNNKVVVVARGNDPKKEKPEDPGSLRCFHFEGGILREAETVAPNDGFGFGPRNVEFDQARAKMYVGMERQNKLLVFGITGDAVPLIPEHTLETMINPANAGSRQMTGAVHMHPNGNVLYVANRADRTREYQGHQVFAGGENNIAVFALDQGGSQPKLIQHINTEGIHARTFAIDPTGKMLVAAHVASILVEVGGVIERVPPSLTTFRIANDGTLEFVNKYELLSTKEKLWWMGICGTA